MQDKHFGKLLDCHSRIKLENRRHFRSNRPIAHSIDPKSEQPQHPESPYREYSLQLRQSNRLLSDGRSPNQTKPSFPVHFAAFFLPLARKSQSASVPSN